MKMVKRTEYGETENGFVFVDEYEGAPQHESDGGDVPRRFDVKHGVRTVTTMHAFRDADRVAKALVKGATEE